MIADANRVRRRTHARSGEVGDNMKQTSDARHLGDAALSQRVVRSLQPHRLVGGSSQSCDQSPHEQESDVLRDRRFNSEDPAVDNIRPKQRAGKPARTDAAPGPRPGGRQLPALNHPTHLASEKERASNIL